MEKCQACGEETTAVVSVGAYRFCRKCASQGSFEIALEIAKHKHREKLKKIKEDLCDS
jgi:hypothetical protein